MSSGSLSSQVAGFSASGSAVTPGSASITGLLSNTLYYYQIEATNLGGPAVSSRSFQTAFPPQLLAEYTFDNTLSDVNEANAFASQTGMTYDPNRYSIANKALYINGTGTTVSLTNLPVGNSSRTFSIWIKATQFNGSNRLFSYGSPARVEAYGASFDASKIYNFSWSNNLNYYQPTSLNVWKHIVCTFDQSTNEAKIYTDFVLRTSGTFSWNTTNNGILYLGSLFGQAGSTYIGYVDDLKIYNSVLLQADITSLHDNNTLSSPDFSQNNLKVALYPNPVNDVLNIESDAEIKSVEIYNLLGQKVKTASTKQVAVFDLQAGTYMVRVEM